MNKITIKKITTRTYLKDDMMETQIVESKLYFRPTEKDQQRANETLSAALAKNAGWLQKKVEVEYSVEPKIEEEGTKNGKLEEN